MTPCTQTISFDSLEEKKFPYIIYAYRIRSFTTTIKELLKRGEVVFKSGALLERIRYDIPK